MKVNILGCALSILLSLFIFSACEKEEENEQGKVEFSFTFPSSGNKRISAAEEPASVLISVEDENGNVLYQKKELEVYTFNDSYLSEPIELNPGNYKLMEFLALDSSGKVIYASPVEGAKLAYLVSKPLPLGFSTQNGITTKVNPQVIEVKDFDPEQFGYSTFTFDVVSTIDFSISIFTYDPATENFELSSANLKIYDSEENLLFDQVIPAATEMVRIVEKQGDIKIVVEKEGYDDYIHHSSSSDLLNHAEDPLIITLFSGVSLNQGLVAYYPFNGNTLDFSGNNLHGTASGGNFTADVDGNSNRAYYFNGLGDYISVANNSLFENQSFSISGWIAPENETGAILSFSRVPNGLNNCGYYFKYEASRPTGKIQVDNSSYEWATLTAETTSVQQETWQHVVFSYDRQELKVYMNGELIASLNENRSVDYTEHNPVILGGYSTRTTGGTWFKGKMDEVKVYNRALTADEVFALSQQ